MKRLYLSMLCVVLVLLLASPGFAEELQTDEEEILLAQEQSDSGTEEIQLEISAPEAEASENRALQLDVSEEIFEEAQSVCEPTLTGEDDSGPSEEPAQGEEEAPPILGEAMNPVTISVRKNAKKTVYLEVPYVLNAKGGIKSVKSSASGVAKASEDGTLALKKKGSAILTIKTDSGKTFKLTLTVKSAPAPTKVEVNTDKSGRMTLSWSGTEYATRYLVQLSKDQKSWTDCKVLPAENTSLDISDIVTGETWFRVVAVLGDHFGGTGKAISVLNPPSGVRVICEESYKLGPTDNMNVVWNACCGATGYEVYSAKLPSAKFKLIGTTKKTWYPVTRNKTRLYAFRVKPVYKALDLPMSDPVTLWSDMQDNVLPPSDLSSKTGILLLVNKKAQVVTAYVKDADGKYTIPLRHMICSTGKTYDRTKNGTYTLKARKGEWYKYPSGCYIRWPSIYRSGYYFHSVLYKSKKKIYTGTIEKLGTRQSQGCIRLKVRDAKWVYKNCPEGTTVYICDGKKLSQLKEAITPRYVSVKGF